MEDLRGFLFWVGVTLIILLLAYGGTGDEDQDGRIAKVLLILLMPILVIFDLIRRH